MQIQRNYRDPFFRERRPNYLKRFLSIVGLLAGIIFILWTQMDQIEATAMDMMGLAPTATPRASDWANQASEAYRLGDVESAIQNMENALAIFPDDENYLYTYANMLIEQDRTAEAFSIAEQLIAIDPTSPLGFAIESRAYVWDSQPNLAIPIARSGLELDDSFVDLYTILARAYVNAGRWNDGLEMAEIAVNLAPESAEAHRSYAHALTSVAEYQLAMQELEQAIVLNPTLIPSYFELAFLYLSNDRDQDAIATYDRILSMQPRNARAQLRLCEAYRKNGEFQRALGYCQDAVDNDPDFITAHFQLAMLHYRDRQFPQALRSFQRCVELDPDNLGCTYRLGLSHYYVQDCDAGWSILQDSLVMAQARNDSEVIENIRQGLQSIASDPNCPAYSNRAPTPLAPVSPTDDISGDT